MPETGATGISATTENTEKFRGLANKRDELKQFSNGKNLGEKLKSAGYDVSHPTEQEGFLCYPHAQVAAQSLQFETCPPDPRFQQQNVTKWCYRMYIDYKRCAHLLGEGNHYCDYFYSCYHSLCPIAWHMKWDEQIENGTFPRDITKDIQPPAPKICEPNPYVHRPHEENHYDR